MKDFFDSEVWNRRGGYRPLTTEFWVDIYKEPWPKVLFANVRDFLPGESYRLEDLRLDLPEGVELSP